jgi:hypothetical protein
MAQIKANLAIRLTIERPPTYITQHIVTEYCNRVYLNKYYIYGIIQSIKIHERSINAELRLDLIVPKAIVDLQCECNIFTLNAGDIVPVISITQNKFKYITNDAIGIVTTDIEVPKDAYARMKAGSSILMRIHRIEASNYRNYIRAVGTFYTQFEPLVFNIKPSSVKADLVKLAEVKADNDKVAPLPFEDQLKDYEPIKDILRIQNSDAPCKLFIACTASGELFFQKIDISYDDFNANFTNIQTFYKSIMRSRTVIMTTARLY